MYIYILHLDMRVVYSLFFPITSIAWINIFLCVHLCESSLKSHLQDCCHWGITYGVYLHFFPRYCWLYPNMAVTIFILFGRILRVPFPLNSCIHLIRSKNFACVVEEKYQLICISLIPREISIFSHLSFQLLFWK